MQALAAKYDTAGKERTFHTADGRDIPLTGPYGWKLDQAAEVQALTEYLKSTDSQTREPVFAQTAASRTEPEWGATYVEIDLTNPHVYMTRGGGLGRALRDGKCVQELYHASRNLFPDLQGAGPHSARPQEGGREL